MKKHFKSICLSVFVLFVFVLCKTPDANAGFVLTLDDLGTTGIDVIVVDEGPAGTSTTKGDSTHVDAVFGTAGLIQYAGTVGDFDINVTTGISKPLIGPATLDLSSVNVTSLVGGSVPSTLVIMLTDTDFSGTAISITDAIGGTTTGTVDVVFGSIDPLNMEFGIGGTPIDTTPAIWTSRIFRIV